MKLTSFVHVSHNKIPKNQSYESHLSKHKYSYKWEPKQISTTQICNREGKEEGEYNQVNKRIEISEEEHIIVRDKFV